jgi:hypothetical protein
MMDALKTELSRTMAHLKNQPTPPYFLSYEVIDTESVAVSGSFGALVSSSPPNRRRQLGIDLRVGSYQLEQHAARFADRWETFWTREVSSPCPSRTMRMRSARWFGITRPEIQARRRAIDRRQN